VDLRGGGSPVIVRPVCVLQQTAPDTLLIRALKLWWARRDLNPHGPNPDHLGSDLFLQVNAHFYLTDRYRWCPLGAMLSRPPRPQRAPRRVIPVFIWLDTMTFRRDVYRVVLRRYPPSSAMTTDRVQAQNAPQATAWVAAASSNWTPTRLPSRRTTLPRRGRSSSSPTVTMSAGWGSKSESFARGLWESQHSTTRSPPTSLGS